uniref:Uncharacterized protein n=1 Tax=Cacopsylla melanoneura TaxID=428564 RepID=A0A8D8YLR9_9HEMI
MIYQSVCPHPTCTRRCYMHSRLQELSRQTPSGPVVTRAGVMPKCPALPYYGPCITATGMHSMRVGGSKSYRTWRGLQPPCYSITLWTLLKLVLRLLNKALCMQEDSHLLHLLRLSLTNTLCFK